MAEFQPQPMDSSEDGILNGPTDPMAFLMEKLNTRGVASRNGVNNFGPPASNPLSKEEQDRLMKSIFELLDESKTMSEDEIMTTSSEDEESEVDLEDQRAKTETLREVLNSVSQLWNSGSQQMDLVVETLADRSREPQWRIPLGDSGILDFFLRVFSTDLPSHSLQTHILRIIGNSCADTDENRARVVSSGSLRSIIDQLTDSPLLIFTIPVLYNICVDYEPAQQQASEFGLSRRLVQLLPNPIFNHDQYRHFLGFACNILSLLITTPSEIEGAPEDTAVVLLKLAIDREFPCDSEDYLLLVNTAIAYLQYDKFRKALIMLGGLDTTLTVFLESYTRFDQPSLDTSHPEEDDAKLLSQMRTNLNHVLSDVSDLSEFREAVPVVSPFTSSLRRWLSSPQVQLQVCACVMLANLARTDEACEQFVHTSQVYKPLVSILEVATDPAVLHAALGFLKNLSLLRKNREQIGNTGLFQTLPRLWHLDTLPDIQKTSISLARVLIGDTYQNVRRICKPLSDDVDSPANMRTNLSFLIALFDRTDVEMVKMEISRLITAICRVFETTKGHSSDITEDTRRRFFAKHPDFGRPLSFMVSQTKWPVVRSEGWFVFALMARYPDGAQLISDMLNDVSVFQPLVELLTGKDLLEIRSSTTSSLQASSPGSYALGAPTPGTSAAEPHAQAAEMARGDRQNALVLVSEMLKNRGTQMAVMRRTLFEDLLRGGSEIVMSYREGKPEWGAGVSELGEGERKIRAGLNLQEASGEAFKELG